MDLDEAEKQDLLQRLDRLEWKTLSDSHPRVHVLCIDFIFENYELSQTCGKHGSTMGTS